VTIANTSDVSLKAEFLLRSRYCHGSRKAGLNLKEKQADCLVQYLYEKKNVYLSGEIEKRGELLLPCGGHTTCDAPVPAWCFGKMAIVLGEK
jgi:hypothetical protein